MNRDLPIAARVVLVGALIGACALGLCGCLGRKGAGNLDQLVVVQYRYNLDATGDTARVYGLVRNTGETRTPPADVVVTLVGSQGSMKGQDRTEVPALKGGEEREFSLEFTSHGKTDHVDIQVVPRGEDPPTEAQDQASGDEAGGDG